MAHVRGHAICVVELVWAGLILAQTSVTRDIPFEWWLRDFGATTYSYETMGFISKTPQVPGQCFEMLKTNVLAPSDCQIVLSGKCKMQTWHKERWTWFGEEVGLCFGVTGPPWKPENWKKHWCEVKRIKPTHINKPSGIIDIKSPNLWYVDCDGVLTRYSYAEFKYKSVHYDEFETTLFYSSDAVNVKTGHACIKHLPDDEFTNNFNHTLVWSLFHDYPIIATMTLEDSKPLWDKYSSELDSLCPSSCVRHYNDTHCMTGSIACRQPFDWQQYLPRNLSDSLSCAYKIVQTSYSNPITINIKRVLLWLSDEIDEIVEVLFETMVKMLTKIFIDLSEKYYIKEYVLLICVLIIITNNVYMSLAITSVVSMFMGIEKST